MLPKLNAKSQSWVHAFWLPILQPPQLDRTTLHPWISTQVPALWFALRNLSLRQHKNYKHLQLPNCGWSGPHFESLVLCNSIAWYISCLRSKTRVFCSKTKNKLDNCSQTPQSPARKGEVSCKQIYNLWHIQTFTLLTGKTSLIALALIRTKPGSTCIWPKSDIWKRVVMNSSESRWWLNRRVKKGITLLKRILFTLSLAKG